MRMISGILCLYLHACNRYPYEPAHIYSYVHTRLDRQTDSPCYLYGLVIFVRLNVDCMLQVNMHLVRN